MVLFESTRLYVRQLEASDEENFFRLNADPDVMRYIRAPKSRAESAAFLQENIDFYQSYPNMGRLALMTKGSNAFAGCFSFLHLEDNVHIHVGYALFTEQQGKGYATEILQASLPFGFNTLHLPKIAAITYPENISSQNVLLKCGFALTAQYTEGGIEKCFFEIAKPAGW